MRPVYMNGPAYGGLFGTARGLARFGQDQLRPRSALFGDATRGLFMSEQFTRGGQTTPTTLGWHAGRLGGVRYYGKPGGGPGYRSNLRIYPDKGVGSAWMANEITASEGPITALTAWTSRGSRRGDEPLSAGTGSAAGSAPGSAASR